MIEIKNLSFSYYRNRMIFNNLNTTFDNGKIYGLLGKNGAGKTTLLKNICGLLYPSEGQITIDNLEAHKRIPEYLNKIFFITEEFMLPKIKFDTYLKIYKDFFPNFDTDKFWEYINLFELPKKNYLSQMSYGQKKKFLISFALASNTELIIMDEPTNGMDIPSKTLFRKIVVSSLDENKTIIISTHQVRDVEGMIDTVKIIDEGKIIFDNDLDIVQEKLTLVKSDKPVEDALYSAEILGGFIHLVPATNTYSSNNIDLELLFNSVIENSQKINETLKN